jgi:glyoxylase-like metal-dependent hydrolase (beta-lactamase superfamily II)
MPKTRSTRSKRAPATAAAPGKGRQTRTRQELPYRARVRMYRHGLGDCFLLTFPRAGRDPFQLLIDCGALSRSAADMRRLAEHIATATRRADGTSRLDLVVVTHEHRDHLSGFNQARDVFERIEIGGVWMGWTEKPGDPQAEELAGRRNVAAARLKAALASPRGVAAAVAGALGGLTGLAAFHADDGAEPDGRRSIADALAYVRHRGEQAGAIEYLEPGSPPRTLDGVEGVRVFALGPPRDPKLLLDSSVTKKRLEEGTIYHLAAAPSAVLAAVDQGLGVADGPDADGERYRPFAKQHAIGRGDDWFAEIEPFVSTIYDHPSRAWRRIDDDWIASYEPLALKLDEDTNNTSLVLAFELEGTGDVLLFVGDAQVGNWLSWEKVSFALPESDQPLPALDLVRRTVFYKVGHHASHNATLKKEGLERMESDRLVAFVPLDVATAKKQGKKGWDMPAAPLEAALRRKSGERLVISDRTRPAPAAALAAGVVDGDEWVDWTCR